MAGNKKASWSFAISKAAHITAIAAVFLAAIPFIAGFITNFQDVTPIQLAMVASLPVFFELLSRGAKKRLSMASSK